MTKECLTDFYFISLYLSHAQKQSSIECSNAKKFLLVACFLAFILNNCFTKKVEDFCDSLIMSRQGGNNLLLPIPPPFKHRQFDFRSSCSNILEKYSIHAKKNVQKLTFWRNFWEMQNLC